MRRHVSIAVIARPRMRIRSSPRSAMTLAELLVVIMIMVLLLGIGVPMMKLPLQENRMREASRQLNVFFAQAQARAREIQRPVAVWIERAGSAGNYATELYLAETPPPYGGDLLDAKLRLSTMGVGSWLLIPVPDETCIGSLGGLAKLGEPFGIKFEYRGPVYLARLGPDSKSVIVTVEAGVTPPPGLQMATGLPFQIYLSPRRSSDAPLQLPAGIAVDLNCSGIGIEMPLGDLKANEHISGIEFAGRWDEIAKTCLPTTTPVLIAVAPDGGIQWVSYDLIRKPATNTVHLLVGRIDHTVVQDNTPTTPNPIRWSATNATNFAYDGNLVDPSTIWVSIASRTGSVTTSENGWQFTGNPVNFRDSLLYSREFAQSARPMVGR